MKHHRKWREACNTTPRRRRPDVIYSIALAGIISVPWAFCFTRFCTTSSHPKRKGLWTMNLGVKIGTSQTHDDSIEIRIFLLQDYFFAFYSLIVGWSYIHLRLYRRCSSRGQPTPQRQWHNRNSYCSSAHEDCLPWSVRWSLCVYMSFYFCSLTLPTIFTLNASDMRPFWCCVCVDSCIFFHFLA